MKKIFALLLVLSLVLAGCANAAAPTDAPTETAPTEAAPTENAPTEGTEAPTAPPVESNSDLFTDRDLSGSFDESKAAHITLSGSSASCDSNAVTVSGSTVTITDAGTYILSGTLDDGMIIVSAEKADKTQLVLNGVSINSETSAPIYILQADKVFITLAPGTENTLSNGGSFVAIDDNNIDAAVFSKEDVTFNGSGSLTINSPAGHGVVSKDELAVAGGTYTVNTASHGLDGKDNVCITGADFTIASGKDGIHAENEDDTALGFVYIESGNFRITAEGDGVSAGSYMTVTGGDFAITAGGGSANAQQQTSNNWGGFMGGMGGGMGGGKPGGGGGMGGPRGGISNSMTSTADDDSTSIKGLKSAGTLTITGGSFTIDSADDAIHSNSDLTVSGGTFEIATGDDGFHADEALTVTDGTILITKSYEGLEGTRIDITGGDITLTATDDGLNAAGGTDQSGFGGFRGGDMFGSGSGNASSYIQISGGSLMVNASGDGIDSNGMLTISGGFVTVCGPTSGDTAVLDYDTTGVITGGTFIGTGAYQMAQTFSDSGQGVIAVSVGNQAAGTLITLTDGTGNTMVSYSPAMSFAIVIISTPEMVKGETYTITVGEASGEFEAS